MPEPKINEIEKIGCEIAYNRFWSHYSRKTLKPKTTEKRKNQKIGCENFGDYGVKFTSAKI